MEFEFSKDGKGAMAFKFKLSLASLLGFFSYFN